MNGEWILQVVTVLIPILVSIIVSAIVGYLLGSKRQKKQILQGHITETVQKEYPSLYAGLRNRSEQLDNYLNKPYVTFGFPKLDQLYKRGLEGFIKKHHKDLFSAIDSFRKNILPKYKELNSVTTTSREKVYNQWLAYLSRLLPKEEGHTSEWIVKDLLTTINQYYTLPLLLNGRYEEARNKIEGCIMERTSDISKKTEKRHFLIRGQTKAIDYDEVYQTFMKIAKPEIAKIVDKHKELKKQNDNEVKERLLPLLKKYISNPI